MAVYLAGFLISFSIAKAIEKWNTKSVGFWVWSFVLLLIPCLIAGLRADTVGTDVLVYARPLYDLAENSSSLSNYFDAHWWSVWRYMGPADYEVGFSLLIWLSSVVGSSFSFTLFVIQAFTIFPIYLALTRVRKSNSISISLGVLVYLLLYFNVSLNLMRQWMAMAFLLLAITYLLDRKQLQYFILSAVAFLFHTSAILICLVVYVFWRYVYSSEGGYARRVLITSTISLLIIVFGLRIAALSLSALGFNEYIQYIGTGEVSIVPSQLLLLAPGVLLLLLFWKRYGGSNSKIQMYLPLLGMVVGVFASQLGSITDQSSRLAQYFSYQAILAFPLAHSAISDRNQRRVFWGASVLYFGIYWAIVYVVMGANQTVPYALA